MNKYFWTWQISCVCYALGIIIFGGGSAVNIFSIGYLCGEIFQVSALLGTIYACSLIQNIPYNYFAVKYGLICIVFFAVDIYFYGINESIYVVMLVFKLLAVIIVLYTIFVKWNGAQGIKAAAGAVFGLSGIYLSLYNFFIYGNTNTPECIFYICLGFVFVMAQNITFALMYKVQRGRREKLKKDYLSNFAENSADIIFYYTIVPYNRFSFVSPASKKLLGYTPENFYSNNKLHVEIALEDDRQRMEDLMGDFEGESAESIITVQSKAGETVKLECIVDKVEDNGKVIAVEGVFRDVTERLEAERKILENNKNRQLMLSYISHDLKTPITYILGYAEAIQKGIIKSDEERIMAMESILDRGKSLTKLVDDISLLSKLEASSFSYEFEIIGCMNLAEKMRMQHERDFSEKYARYTFINRDYKFVIGDEVGQDVFVLADVKRIEQVFENIFSNAMKVTEDGGKIYVKCGIDKIKDSFYVSVKDDGCGISEEDLPHIFENFYRSPQTKKRLGGSGLGLSLSQQIINGHHGELKVISKLGVGSEFTMLLPLFDIGENSTIT